jgi:pimeloyl-ACP methyl ester carboxylesterase
MRGFHCTWVLLLALALPAAAQQPQTAVPPANATGYTVFLRGTPLGHQDITIRATADGLVVSGQGQIAYPIDVTTRSAEIRYRGDQTPESLKLDAIVGANTINLTTTFANGMAVSKGTQGVNEIASTDAVTPQTIILPNIFFGAHAVLARRLAGVAPGAEFHAFVGPGGPSQVAFRLRSETTETMQTGTQTFNARHYELVFDNGDMPLAMAIYADDLGGLIRVSVPAQEVDVVRDDVAGAISRTHVVTNPGDEAVTIPAAGFNLGATITHPMGAAGRVGAVVLVGGSDSDDRDGTAYGVPILAQLAAAASRAGFLAVRYDKRGFGQSGGRQESATLNDMAEDVRAVVKWVSNRKDIDPKRIAVIGHAEGGWVALLAASKDKNIGGIVTIDAPSTTGAQLSLEQQQHVLERLKVSPAERDERVALQKKIQDAVLSGKGWEGVPEPMRKAADTPWTQSVLAFDPAKVVDDVRQPLLLIHAELDRQIPASHVERLADLARKESKSKAVEVLTVRGVNHLLVPAVTGEADEYATLPDLNLSKDITGAVESWLAKTLPAGRK